jgi:hypothetical protein
MLFVDGNTGYFKKHDTLPTVRQLMNVYNLPAESDPTYEEREELLLWYHDELLPMALGQEQCAPKIRHYFSPVTKRDYGNGIEMPTVTCIGEGFGLVVYDNCRTKWLAILPKKIANDNWKVPKWSKTDTSTHKYHVTRWSDSRNGQVKDGGWGPGAFAAMNEYIQFIHKRRVDDRKSGFAKHKFAFEIMRRKNDITFDSPKEKARSKKKRTREPVTYAALVLDEPGMDIYDDTSMPIYEA